MVGSFLFFCIILAMIFRGSSLKLGSIAAIGSGLLFFVFIYSITKDSSIALGAGAALTAYTL